MEFYKSKYKSQWIGVLVGKRGFNNDKRKNHRTNFMGDFVIVRDGHGNVPNKKVILSRVMSSMEKVAPVDISMLPEIWFI